MLTRIRNARRARHSMGMSPAEKQMRAKTQEEFSKQPAAPEKVSSIVDKRGPVLMDARIFGALTLPGGRQIRTMREDAFQAALAASRGVKR